MRSFTDNLLIKFVLPVVQAGSAAVKKPIPEEFIHPNAGFSVRTVGELKGLLAQLPDDLAVCAPRDVLSKVLLKVYKTETLGTHLFIEGTPKQN